MKKMLSILSVAVSLAMGARAQQQPQQHSQRSQYLIVTVYEDYGLGGNSRLVETREDGSQAIKEIKWNSPYNFKRAAAHEDSLMVQLKPFFDDGWNLVSTNTVPSGTPYSAVVTRYFLRKEGQ